VGVVVGTNNKSSRGGGAGNIIKRKNNIYHPRRQHGYFLLLDPLCETLHQRIQSVYVPEVIDTPLRIYSMTTAATTTAATNNNFDLSTTSITSLSEFNNTNNTNNKKYISNESQARIQLSNRLSSLKSIASALQYLHEDCNIVYRDIKPGNIGFYRRYDNCGCQCGHCGAHSNFEEDEDGGGVSRSDGTSSGSTLPHCTCNHTDIPKLFDFGLAKELKSKYRKCHPNHNNDIDPPTYKLTSASGSRRYMSPEVALREPYNHKADVYSFGVVLYQIAALVVPFDGLEMQSHERDVMRGGIRPDLSIPSRDSSVRRTRDFRKHYVKERDRERKNLLLSKRAKCVWPEGLGALIGECWDGDMRKRPEMREVVDRLDACIQELQTGQI
jgi:serine/threonine protein kinase